MNLSGSITIEKVIIHILDKDNKKCIKSDYEIELNDKISNLIIGHLTQAARKSSRVFAKFKKEDNSVRKACINIFDDNTMFIENSKVISDVLYTAMVSTSTTSANLMIVKYLCGVENMLAILKLDFDDSFTTEEIKDNSKSKVVVKTFNNSFSKNHKLRKCAILGSDINDIENAFLLLDTQDSNVSSFFKNAFLNCELINDSKANTKSMTKELTNFITKIKKDTPQKMIETIYTLTSEMKENEEFNLDDILTKLNFTPEEKNEFILEVKDKKIDFTFSLDKETLAKLLQNQKVITENGIVIKANSCEFDEKIVIEELEDGKANIIIKNVVIDKNQFSN